MREQQLVKARKALCGYRILAQISQGKVWVFLWWYNCTTAHPIYGDAVGLEVCVNDLDWPLCVYSQHLHLWCKGIMSFKTNYLQIHTNSIQCLLFACLYLKAICVVLGSPRRSLLLQKLQCDYKKICKVKNKRKWFVFYMAHWDERMLTAPWTVFLAVVQW